MSFQILNLHVTAVIHPVTVCVVSGDGQKNNIHNIISLLQMG